MNSKQPDLVDKALSIIEERVLGYDSGYAAISRPTLPERFFDLWRYWISCLSFSHKVSKEQTGSYDYYDPYHHQKRAAAGGECFVAAIPMVLFSLWLLYVCTVFPLLCLPLVFYVICLAWHYYSRDGKLQALAKKEFKEKNEKAIDNCLRQLRENSESLGDRAIVRVTLKGKLLSTNRKYDDVSALFVFAQGHKCAPELLLNMVEIDGNSIPDIAKLCEELDELPFDIDDVEETFDKPIGSLADSSVKQDGNKRLRTVLHMAAFITMLAIGIGTFALPIDKLSPKKHDVATVQPFTTAPREGSFVLARYKGSTYGFFGKVARQDRDGNFEVHYLDEDIEVVKRDCLFVPELVKGTSVQFWLERNGKEGWVFAKVQSMSKNEVKVVPSDGNVYTVDLAKIRVPIE